MRHFLANMLGVGLVTLVDDSGDLQELQVTEKAYGSGFIDRILDKIFRITEFGFSSNPPIDAEALMLRRAADRGASIVIGTSHRPSRPKNLQPGDTAVYDVRGATLKFTADGTVLDAAGLTIVIQNASKITLDAPEVDITGALKVAGDITALTGGQPLAMSSIRAAHNGHTHPVSGSTASATSDDL